MLPRTLASFLLVVTLFAPAGCKKKKSDTVVGSCDQPKKEGVLLSSRVCTDYYDKTAVCTTGIASTKPCDRTGAVAACKGDVDRWYYDDDSSFDAQALSKICSGSVILPSGAAFTPKSDAAVNGDKVKDNMIKSGAKAKTNIAAVSSIKTLPPPTGKVKLEGLKGDAILMHAEDLADPENPKPLAYRLARTDALAACSRILAGRATASDDGNVLSSCANFQVYAVVSVNTFHEPGAVGETRTAKTKTTFVNRGKIAGNVFLFRMDNAKPLGSFAFGVENAPVSPSSTVDGLKAELLRSYELDLFTREHTAAPELAISFDLASKH